MYLCWLCLAIAMSRTTPCSFSVVSFAHADVYSAVLANRGAKRVVGEKRPSQSEDD
jgi:hypothetical protein